MEVRLPHCISEYSCQSTVAIASFDMQHVQHIGLVFHRVRLPMHSRVVALLILVCFMCIKSNFSPRQCRGLSVCSYVTESEDICAVAAFGHLRFRYTGAAQSLQWLLWLFAKDASVSCHTGKFLPVPIVPVFV